MFFGINVKHKPFKSVCVCECSCLSRLFYEVSRHIRYTQRCNISCEHTLRLSEVSYKTPLMVSFSEKGHTSHCRPVRVMFLRGETLDRVPARSQPGNHEIRCPKQPKNLQLTSTNQQLTSQH